MHQTVSRKVIFSRQELALIGITFLWGGTFLIVHTAVQQVGPLFFVGLRFLTAGTLSLLFFRKTLRGLTRTELFAGTAIGMTIFMGYTLQTFGLKTINSSTSAFLTALYVPMVPLMQWGLMNRRPKAMTWLGIALAFAGLICLAGPGVLDVGLGIGEIATLISAAAIAGEILLIGRFAAQVDATRITTVQLFAAGMISLLAMPLAGEAIPAFAWTWVAAGVGLGLMSAVIQLTMNWAQKSVSPARATIIYAGEPVWAGIIGRLAGDRLPGLALFGALLIVIGVVVSELKPRSKVAKLS